METPSSDSTPLQGRFGRGRWPRRRHVAQRRVFVIASILVLSHVAVEMAVSPPPGLSWTTRMSGSSVVLGLSVAGMASLSTASWQLPALLVALRSAFTLPHGVIHCLTASWPASAVDVTGMAMMLAAAVDALLAVTLVGSGRRSGSRKGPRRFLFALRWVGAVAVVVGLLLPVGVGTALVHLPRRDAGPPPATDFARTTLTTDDGVALAAWYHRSANGSAVVMLNPARGDHLAVTEHARLLASRGYGVLVYDARGTGASQGTPNGWGWTWRPDAEAIIDYLGTRPDVTGRIALVGLSTGADVALEVAARDPRVSAVVADGATAQGFADRPSGLVAAVTMWPMYMAATALTGETAQPSLAGATAAIAPRPVLLIAAGSIPQEIPLNERYREAGGPTVSLWSLPSTGHTRALRENEDEYADRVLSFLDRALLRDPSSPSSDDLPTRSPVWAVLGELFVQ